MCSNRTRRYESDDVRSGGSGLCTGRAAGGARERAAAARMAQATMRQEQRQYCGLADNIVGNSETRSLHTKPANERHGGGGADT